MHEEKLSEKEKQAIERLKAETTGYETLEQQIQKLWASRGLEVLEERVEPLTQGEFRWIIIARVKHAH